MEHLEIMEETEEIDNFYRDQKYLFRVLLCFITFTAVLTAISWIGECLFSDNSSKNFHHFENIPRFIFKDKFRRIK